MNEQQHQQQQQQQNASMSVLMNIQQLIDQAVQLETNKVKSAFSVKLSDVVRERDNAFGFIHQLKARLEQESSGQQAVKKVKDAYRAELTKLSVEVQAIQRRIDSLLNDDVQFISPHLEPKTVANTVVNGLPQLEAKLTMNTIDVLSQMQATQSANSSPVLVPPPYGMPEFRLTTADSGPSIPQETIDLVSASSAFVSPPASNASKKEVSAAKRVKTSNNNAGPADELTDVEKEEPAKVFYLLQKKSHSSRIIDFADCEKESVDLTKADFANFAKHFGFSDLEKQVAIDKYKGALSVPFQAVSASCIVCGVFCNKGVTGIYCTHTTCSKCFAMYLYFSGEKLMSPNWKTKDRYLKCPGEVLGKKCIEISD